MEETVLEFTAVILAFFAGAFLVAASRPDSDSLVRFITPFIWMVLAFVIVQLV